MTPTPPPTCTCGHDTDREQTVARIKAAIRLIQPDHLTPMGARQLRAALEDHA